jgi:hypothetical protein
MRNSSYQTTMGPDPSLFSTKFRITIGVIAALIQVRMFFPTLMYLSVQDVHVCAIREAISARHCSLPLRSPIALSSLFDTSYLELKRIQNAQETTIGLWNWMLLPHPPAQYCTGPVSALARRLLQQERRIAVHPVAMAQHAYRPALNCATLPRG